MKKNKLKSVFNHVAILIVIAGFFTIGNKSQAQSYDGGAGLFYGYVGTTIADINTGADFEITGINVPEEYTRIELEKDLDFPSSSALLYVKAMAGGSFQVVASYMSLHRSGEKNITRDFAYADQVYNVGANVKGYFNTDYYAATLRYSFLHNDRITAGISLGGRYLKLAAGIDANSNGVAFARDGTFDIPVIVPGVHASVHVIPALLLRGSLEYFELELSGTKGMAADAQISAEFYLFKFLGAGIGYSYIDLKGEGLPENSLYLKNINYTVKGLNIFAAFRF